VVGVSDMVPVIAGAKTKTKERNMKSSFIRKSVALSTCAAFGVVGFIGAPASAFKDVNIFEERVSSVDVAPTYGDTFTVPYFNDFYMSVDLNGDLFFAGTSTDTTGANAEETYQGQYSTTVLLADLKLRVQGVDKDDYELNFDDEDNSSTYFDGDEPGDFAWYDDGDDDSDVVFSFENESDIDSFDYLDFEWDSNFDSTYVDGAEVTLTFWRDTDDDDKIDGSEWKSADTVITFLGEDELEMNATLDLEYGDDWWDVEYETNFNNEMVYEDQNDAFSASLLRNGDVIDETGVDFASDGDVDVYANTQDGDLDAASYTVETYVYDGVDGETLVSSTSLRIRTPRVSYIDNFGVVAGPSTANYIYGTDDDDSDYIEADVRAGTTAITIEGYAYDSDDAAVRNATIHIDLDDWDEDLEDDTVWTINGVDYLGEDINDADFVFTPFALTTDSDGRFSFEFETSNADITDADDEELQFSAFEPYSDESDFDYVWIDWTTAYYQAFDVLGGDEQDGPVRSITIGDTLDITYTIVDQWGTIAPDGRVLQATRSSLTGTERTTTGEEAVWNSNASDEDTIFLTTSNGFVNLVVEDNGEGEGTDIVTLTGVTNSIDLDSDHETEVNYLDTTAVYALEVFVDNDGVTDFGPDGSGYSDDEDDWEDADAAIALEALPLTAIDHRYQSADYIDYTYNAAVDADGTSDAVNVEAYLVDEDGAPLQGVEITFSSANLLFSYEDSESSESVRALGSITVVSDSDGYATVDVFGNTAGAQVVTVTSGGKSSTITLTFEQKDVEAIAFVDAPATIVPGEVATFTVKATDEDGNTVSGAAVTWSTAANSAGVVLNENTTTDADGLAFVKVLVGTSDLGKVFAITAKNTTTITASATGTVAYPAVNAVVGTFQGRWAVRVENAMGSVVTVKAGGNWYTYIATSDNYLFSRQSKVGAEVPVTVWVDRVKVKTQTITVK